jgi:predicted DNA-binding transcriptional regulator YafY
MRQWKILCACETPSGMSAAELIEYLGVGRRTLYRDLSLLKLCGAHLEIINDGSVVRYRSRQPFFRPTTSVT